MSLTSETKSILEQISDFKLERTPPASSSKRASSRRILAVLETSPKDGRQALAELSILRRFGCSLDVVAPLDVRTSRGLSSQCDFHCLSDAMPDGFLDGADCIVAVLDRGAAAKICLGIQDDLGTQVLLEALWQGLDVYADLSGVMRPETSNIALRTVYEGYVEEIGTLGVRGIERGNYLPVLLERFGVGRRNRPAPASSENPAAVLEQRLVVTGKDIRELDAGTEWRLPCGAIVTDVAKEMAERMGIELIFHSCAGEGVPRHADS